MLGEKSLLLLRVKKLQVLRVKRVLVLRGTRVPVLREDEDADLAELGASVRICGGLMLR